MFHCSVRSTSPRPNHRDRLPQPKTSVADGAGDNERPLRSRNLPRHFQHGGGVIELNRAALAAAIDRAVHFDQFVTPITHQKKLLAKFGHTEHNPNNREARCHESAHFCVECVWPSDGIWLRWPPSCKPPLGGWSWWKSARRFRRRRSGGRGPKNSALLICSISIA